MSRQKTAISTRDIIIFITTVIAIITAIFKFLAEVNRLSLWKEFFIATAILVGSNYIAYNLGNSDIFLVTLIITLIAYCIFWNYKFSYKSTRLNAALWKERQWWWTLDGWQFEQEVANVFRINGYNAKVTKGSGDGGVDIILKRNGRTSIVQCKHYQNPVPPEPIRALWGCKDDFGADEVILVASSGITDMGARFVQNKPNFKVLNLDDIIIMGNKAQSENKLQENKKIDELIEQSNEIKSPVRSGRKLDI
ncbi:restriction endonuclease family protein [Brachyspira sp. CAG:484]|nr:restriction endonuclease family protein [Brachyspira sp. CAG:484]